MPIQRVANFIGPIGIRRLADDIRRAYPHFALNDFVEDASAGIEQFSLFGRADRIARVLPVHLAQPFPKLVRILVEASGPPRADGGYGPMENFRFLALTRTVSMHGARHFADAMWALKELTTRFTAEFDVRPFLVTDESQTLHTLRGWLEDDNMHVRRLVSEGTRTRLPWGSHLRSLQRSPTKGLSLIEHLKADPAPYVQVSVANNLADIIKDDPSVGLAIAERWADSGHPITRRIVHHAVRYPAKQGSPRAQILRRLTDQRRATG